MIVTTITFWKGKRQDGLHMHEVGMQFCVQNLAHKCVCVAFWVCFMNLHLQHKMLDTCTATDRQWRFSGHSIIDHCREGGKRSYRQMEKLWTYHHEFYGDGHWQLFPVAGVEFFDHNEDGQNYQTDHKGPDVGLRK